MDEMMIELGAALCVGILIAVAIKIWVRSPGASLSGKFKKMGVLRGKTFAEISRVVGAPTSVQYTSDGSIRVWSRATYTIALIFDSNDICQGVSSETAV